MFSLRKVHNNDIKSVVINDSYKVEHFSPIKPSGPYRGIKVYWDREKDIVMAFKQKNLNSNDNPIFRTPDNE